jgi:ABC-type branched-subunit amino acid transport system ATPase component
VALGREAAFAGWNPLDHVLALGRQRSSIQQWTNEAIELCGLGELVDVEVGALSTGQRRLVELARCVAGDHDVLLLDEPSSGLDRSETARFGEILRVIVTQRDIGILLVEHDIALINSVCDYVYVIDFGKPIFDGTAQQVVSSSLVRRVYLGDAEGEEETDLDGEIEGART